MEQQVSYQKIGVNRDRPRLWIEGAKLNICGFVPGARYEIDIEGDMMIIRLDENGTRKVSGKTRGARTIPVLDLTLRELEETFGLGNRARVVFTPGRITATLHHEDRARQDREQRLQSNPG